jgi:glycogen(starch) synthase
MMRDPSIERLLLTADTAGGVWTFALDLARSLADGGMDILLASSGPEPAPHQTRAAEGLSRVKWVHRTAALEWMDDPWVDVAATGKWLLDLEAEFHPDLVQLDDYSHGSLPWNAPVLIVAHSCVFSWWRAVLGTSPPARYARYQRRIKNGLSAAHQVVAPTRAMLDCLEQEHGILPHTEVIPNGRTLPAADPTPKLPLIFSAGRLWDQAKNITLLNEIAGELLWPTYVAGATSESGGDSAAFPHLQALGVLPPGEMAKMFARASIYAAPALYEPFGLAILEAALHGCALVLADIPSLRETWEGAALFVPPRDQAAWLETLHDLSINGEKRQLLGESARARARHFTARRMAEGYLRVYAQILGEQRAELNPLVARRAA